MSIPSIVELTGVFENPGDALRYLVIHDALHATMITQVGVSPSTITNWAISLRGLVIWDIENNDLADAQIGG